MAQPTQRERCYVTGEKPKWKYMGTIRNNCETGEEYAAFLGVPYAEIPEGLNRYQAPESIRSNPEPDNSIPVYDANVVDKMSLQYSLARKKFEGSPDCLYMNIFLPRRLELIKETLPVLVFIHGGGFIYGSNDYETYTPDSIIQEDLIFITINYRLGIHGFLNMHRAECPGNAGLKDQVKALEWIKENIKCFMGDPENVTISGSSAGGTCVNLHLISPMSQNLFHKAIIQSGGIFSPWGYRGRRREQLKTLIADRRISRWLFAEQDSEKLHIRVDEVLTADREKRHPFSTSPLFGPTVETVGEERFIPQDIEEMMANVQHVKPVMAGIAHEEGLNVLTPKDIDRVLHSDDKFRQLLMDNLRWDSETAAGFVDQIRERYFPRRLNLSSMEKDRCYANLYHDLNFRRFYDQFRFGPDKEMHKNLYVYQFDHISELNEVASHASHLDELRYLYCPYPVRRVFKKYLDPGEYQNTELRKVMKHMCSLWGNFCKTGIPMSTLDKTVVWRRHRDEDACYLSIDKNLVLKEESLYWERWNWLNALVEDEPTVQSLPPSPQ